MTNDLFDERRFSALATVAAERQRQEILKQRGKFPYTCADSELSHGDKLAILVEEVGEVSRAICEKDDRALREELIQVAAVAVAWIESLPI